MIKLTREVKGSTGNLYSIEVQRKGDEVAAFCDCKAGAQGSICKHVLNVLGEPEVVRFVSGSPLGTAMEAYRSAAQVAESAEHALSAAQEAVKVALREGQQALGHE